MFPQQYNIWGVKSRLHTYYFDNAIGTAEQAVQCDYDSFLMQLLNFPGIISCLCFYFL